MKITRSPTRLLSKLTADDDLDMLTLYQVKRLASPASGEALRKGSAEISNADIHASAGIVESKLSLAQGTQALYDKIATDIGTHNNLFTGIHGITVVRKASDETVNNVTTIQNDDDLVFESGADDVWLGLLCLFHISASTTPDIDYAFSLPSGGAIRSLDALSRTGAYAYSDLASESRISVETTEKYALLFFLYIGGGTAGSVQLQWAQNNAVEENTVVKAQSFILCYRLK